MAVLGLGPDRGPGLDPRISPAIHALLSCAMGGWVYIMTHRRNGTLHIGVTSDLPRCAYEHREGLIRGFTKRYGLKRLVYCGHYPDIRDAIQRESTMKHWSRVWRVRLINGFNPEWDDLYETLA
jgi:putative endonuclease